MSAINAMLQRNAVHMMTDGLSYIDGVPFEVDRQKTIVLDGMSAALSCTGPCMLGEYVAGSLQRFKTFDALIAHGADVIRAAFLKHVREHRNGDAIANLVLIGRHETTRRPALYAMDMETDGEQLAKAQEHGSGSAGADAFKLIETDCVAFPAFKTAQQMIDASYDLAAPLDGKDAEIDLLHLMEIQRRMEFYGHHVVGGEVTMTTIDASGVTQRRVHCWDEDRPGLRVQPRAIDWNGFTTMRRSA